jgi:hypothetical protein
MAVSIIEANAWKAWQQADEAGRKLLADLFKGQITFSDKIADRIKSIDDVIAEARALGYKSYQEWEACAEWNGVAMVPKHVAGYLKLCMITDVLNEGWKPDFSDSNQPKYYSWMKYTAGSGFSYFDFVGGRSVSGVGARLCYRTSDLAKYAATQFQDVYNQFFSL